MDLKLLITNLTDPTLLFFILGIIAKKVKSDLEVPKHSVKFISLYLLFAIGFKGGQELAHNEFTVEIIYAILFGLVVSAFIPLYTFFLLKRKLSVSDAGAVAAAYGSVSAVTFVSAVSFLEAQAMNFSGYMVAVMAFMEAPAIVVGVMLMRVYDHEQPKQNGGMGSIVVHAFTNGSVLLILGSLLIGILADSNQAEGIKPFTTDIFKGFLAIFLLDLGMVVAERISSFGKYGLFVTIFALVIPAINGCAVAWLSQLVTDDIGNRFMFAILAASASYIAVPAAMRLAAPKADPGLFIPMALGLTFPFNITVGMPIYMAVIRFL